MAIPIAALPEGARVKVVQRQLPLDPAVVGRTGTVIAASEYSPQSVGVVLDGEAGARYFARPELQLLGEPALAPERETAKRRRALP